MWVTELLQADGDQVPLQAGFLDTGHREVVLYPRTQGWGSTTLHYIVSFRLKTVLAHCARIRLRQVTFLALLDLRGLELL